MDMQVANVFNEAASGLIQAAEKMTLITQMQIEMHGMIAENNERDFKRQSPAYTEEDFARLREGFDSALKYY